MFNFCSDFGIRPLFYMTGPGKEKKRNPEIIKDMDSLARVITTFIVKNSPDLSLCCNYITCSFRYNAFPSKIVEILIMNGKKIHYVPKIAREG